MMKSTKISRYVIFYITFDWVVVTSYVHDNFRYTRCMAISEDFRSAQMCYFGVMFMGLGAGILSSVVLRPFVKLSCLWNYDVLCILYALCVWNTMNGMPVSTYRVFGICLILFRYIMRQVHVRW